MKKKKGERRKKREKEKRQKEKGKKEEKVVYSSTNKIYESGGNTRKGKFLNENSEVHKDQVVGTRLKVDFVINSYILEAF